MALVKTGSRYPIEIVFSFTYLCDKCKNKKTVNEAEEYSVCSDCGSIMQLISSHSEKIVK